MGIGFWEIVAIISLATGLLALYLSTRAISIATSSEEDLAAVLKDLCEGIKANPGAYGFDSYCDFINNPLFTSISKYCDSNGCK